MQCNPLRKYRNSVETVKILKGFSVPVGAPHGVKNFPKLAVKLFISKNQICRNETLSIDCHRPIDHCETRALGKFRKNFKFFVLHSNQRLVKVKIDILKFWKVTTLNLSKLSNHAERKFIWMACCGVLKPCLIEFSFVTNYYKNKSCWGLSKKYSINLLKWNLKRHIEQWLKLWH